MSSNEINLLFFRLSTFLQCRFSRWFHFMDPSSLLAFHLHTSYYFVNFLNFFLFLAPVCFLLHLDVFFCFSFPVLFSLLPMSFWFSLLLQIFFSPCISSTYLHLGSVWPLIMQRSSSSLQLIWKCLFIHWCPKYEPSSDNNLVITCNKVLLWIIFNYKDYLDSYRLGHRNCNFIFKS